MEPGDGMSWEGGAVTKLLPVETGHLHQQQEQELHEQQQREQQTQSLRKQPSHEQIQVQVSGVEVFPNSLKKPMDSTHVTETRKISVTQPGPAMGSPSRDKRRRVREDEEEAARKRANAPTTDKRNA